MMEKRVVLAAILSALFLLLYGQVLSNVPAAGGPRPQARPGAAPSPAPAVLSDSQAAMRAIDLGAQEAAVRLTSKFLEASVSIPNGAVTELVLKEFEDVESPGPVVIRPQIPLLVPALSGRPGTWRVAQLAEDAVRLEPDDSERRATLEYRLDPSGPFLDIELSGLAERAESLALISSWAIQNDDAGRWARLEGMGQSHAGSGARYEKIAAPVRGERALSRDASRLTLCEHYFCQSLAHLDGATARTLLWSPAGSSIAARSSIAGAGPGYRGRIYVGARDFFYRNRFGVGDALTLGFVEKIGLMLLGLLRGLAALTKNYGTAILLFSVLVTCALSPFTLISFRSMKRMSALKPEMDRLMAKHKGDATQANREIFALYKQHRVSPLSGCLPMLLQLPILMALFQAIPNFIGLRGQGFLWIRDLAMPDRALRLPTALPVVGEYLNILPIVMAAVMYVQTKVSQRHMPQDTSNPASKLLSGPLMSVLFGVMFYQVPSSLVLYWLTNSLVSIVWYRLAK
jgi:YidC/Oxa1 family membrane protein insertase